MNQKLELSAALSPVLSRGHASMLYAAIALLLLNQPAARNNIAHLCAAAIAKAQCSARVPSELFRADASAAPR